MVGSPSMYTTRAPFGGACTPAEKRRSIQDVVRNFDRTWSGSRLDTRESRNENSHRCSGVVGVCTASPWHSYSYITAITPVELRNSRQKKLGTMAVFR